MVASLKIAEKYDLKLSKNGFMEIFLQIFLKSFSYHFSKLNIVTTRHSPSKLGSALTAPIFERSAPKRVWLSSYPPTWALQK